MSAFPIFKSQTYADRNALLLRMGFKCYSDYLASELWKKLHNQVLTAAKRKCTLCKRKAILVHHTSYHLDVLQGKDTSHLHAMCKKCHKKIEFKGKHKKSMTQAWFTFAHMWNWKYTASIKTTPS